MRWARETARLTLEEASTKLQLSSPERLIRVEAGDEEVSRPLLERMSKVYRRSLLTFYLDAPPREGNRGQDFRTLPAEQPDRDEAYLSALVRDVVKRQSMVRSLVVDEKDATALPYVGSARIEEGAEATLRRLVEVFRVDRAAYRAHRTLDSAFAYLRGKAEESGVFVVLIGNLGSHHTALPVETFRGFALADPVAPFIVINDQDAPAAWSFTLLHELTHILLGASGVSNIRGEAAIERFCNEVASSFLLLDAELGALEVHSDTPEEDALRRIERFAKDRHISMRMVAYALYRTGEVPLQVWRQWNAAISRLWIASRQRVRDMARQQDGGPSFYVVRRHRLGRALLGLVDRNVSSGALTPSAAARVLGVKPRSVYPLLAA